MSTLMLVGLLASDASVKRAAADGGDDGGDRRSPHVLLLSVDGLHALDLARWVQSNPNSALARLSHTGVTYAAAKAPTPSDSFPGLLALVTGGTPRSTGVYYDDSYDRTLYAPGSNCAGDAGTEVLYDESLDHDFSQLFSGGMDPINLPLAKDRHGNCKPVYPHQFLKVNTIFEVAKEGGLRTAWADKHPSYDLINGPSGHGVDDLYTPEVNSNIVNGGTANGVNLAATKALCDGTNSLPPAKVQQYVDCLPAIKAYDDVKVQAIVNQIHGWSADGTSHRGVPNLFGMNFQAVSVGQKLPIGGYSDTAGTPSPGLLGAIAHTDASIGRMIDALQTEHLWESTLVIISAKHGQSPIDRSKLAMEPGATQAPVQNVVDPLGFINNADPAVDNNVFTDNTQTNGSHDYSIDGHLQTDDVGIVWLQDQSKQNIDAVVAQLTGNAAQIHATVLPPRTIFTNNITYGTDLAKIYGDPTSNDPVAAARAPNIFIQPDEGVIYSGSKKKIAEHGGGAPGDTEVALLVAGADIEPDTNHRPVSTTQVAPTILRALGLDPNELDAVQKEHTHVLPGLDFVP